MPYEPNLKDMKISLKLFLGTVLVFWNVENFFDYRTESTLSGKNWTAGRFYSKARGVGKVLLELAEEKGEAPMVVGLAEIDSPKTLKAIVYSDVLSAFGYRFVHYESHDHRGIDCALLYRNCRVVTSRAIPLTFEGKVVPSRDLLYVEFDSLAVVVCHLPSKRGGSELAGKRRERAMEMLDSIAGTCSKRLIVMGDFNEERREGETLTHLREVEPKNGTGSIKYQGRWEMIDRCMSTDTSGSRLEVAALEALSERDKRFGGYKPLRTYSGPRYLGGLSDHYPIVMEF